MIMGHDANCFIPTFNSMWSQELQSHKMKYAEAAQLVSGNRLRPILLAWGYYANSRNNNNELISKYAICIELIHKASILLDDWVDSDVARHGVKTFHIEYSQEEAILYSIFLINRSIQIMNELDKNSIDILLQTINDMSYGGIQEVSLNSAFEKYNVPKIKEIISLETTKLIECAFTIGYQLSSTQKNPTEIVTIGNYAGYCFQILNDLEPFMSTEKNKDYKGKLNYDSNKNRKSIVMAYLYGACSKRERSILDAPVEFDTILLLIKKHNIIKLVLEEVDYYTNEIKKAIQILEIENLEKNYSNEFRSFLSSMFNVCYSKLDLFISHDIFNN